VIPADKIGHAEIAFADGETYEVEADLRFSKVGGRIKGEGTFRSNQAFSIMNKVGSATISFGSFSINIIINRADMSGSGHFITSGAPITS